MISELKLLIAKDKIEELIDRILADTYINATKEFFNEAILISSDFFAANKKYAKNLITNEEHKVELNKIKSRLLDFLDSLPENFEENKKLETIHPWRQKLQLVEIHAAKEFSKFDFDQKENLLLQIANFTNTDPEKIIFVGIREGSVVLSMWMPTTGALGLLEKFKNKKHDKFFSDLKIDDVKIVFSSIGSLLWYGLAKLSRLFRNKKMLASVFVVVIISALVVFNNYNNNNNNKNKIKLAKIQVSKNLIDEYSSQIAKEITLTSSLNNLISTEIKKLGVDSLDKTENSDFSFLIESIKKLAEAYDRADEIAAKLTEATQQFEGQTNEVVVDIPNNNKNIILKAQLKSGLEKAQTNVASINAGIKKNKGATQLMLMLITTLEKKNKNKKTEELIYAANTLLEKISPTQEGGTGKS